jgi:hypothetical protein
MKAQLAKMMRKVENEFLSKRKAPEAASKAVLNCLAKKKTQIQTVMADIERIIDNKAELLFADTTGDKVRITPDFQCKLDSVGRFVKYIGGNLLFVQDEDGKNYFLTADSLQLLHKQKLKTGVPDNSYHRVLDICANEKFICMACAGKKVLILDKQSTEKTLLKTIDTKDQLNAVQVRKDKYFYCGGQNGFIVKFDTSQPDFKEISLDNWTEDIISIKFSKKNNNTEFGINSDEQIVTDMDRNVWMFINKDRQSFYVFDSRKKENQQQCDIKIDFDNTGFDGGFLRVEEPDFRETKALEAHPNFWHDKHQFMALMDKDEDVNVYKVNMRNHDRNTDFLIDQFEPGCNLLTCFGSAKHEQFAQMQAVDAANSQNGQKSSVNLIDEEASAEMNIAALNTKTDTIWLKKLKKDYFDSLVQESHQNQQQ